MMIRFIVVAKNDIFWPIPAKLGFQANKKTLIPMPMNSIGTRVFPAVPPYLPDFCRPPLLQIAQERPSLMLYT